MIKLVVFILTTLLGLLAYFIEPFNSYSISNFISFFLLSIGGVLFIKLNNSEKRSSVGQIKSITLSLGLFATAIIALVDGIKNIT